MDNHIQKFLTICLITIAYSFVISTISAQSYETNATLVKTDFSWPEGKKMALSLTFDDARLTQIDKGIPLLDKYGVKATFYVSPGSMLKRLEGWKKAVSSGHDIGNHSITHP
jgi:peptidoglycan/xylan/chitin deacetylase (PgdA/CDA1 family)